MKTFKQFVTEYGYTDVALHQAHGDVRDALEALGLDTESYDNVLDKIHILGIKIIKGLDKVDKIVGFKKTILLSVPTYKAKINFLTAVYRLSRHPKKLSSWQEVLSSLTELSKLGLMNPVVAVPSALAFAKGMGIKDHDALVAIMIKMLSTSYFYLETVSNIMKNSNNDKVKQVASAIYKMMPKSEIKH